MQLKSVIKPAMLFAAGGIASGAQATAVDIAATDGGTPIYLFGSTTAQFTYDTDVIANGNTKYYLKSADGTQNVTLSIAPGSFPNADSGYSSQLALFEQAPNSSPITGFNPVGIRVNDNGVIRYGRVTGNLATLRITDITIDGVSNPSIVVGNAVPEPATWATAVLGLGMAGAALRRRRRQPALAIAA